MNRFERWLAEHPDAVKLDPNRPMIRGKTYHKIFIDEEALEASRYREGAFVQASEVLASGGAGSQLYGISANSHNLWRGVNYSAQPGRITRNMLMEFVERASRRGGS